MPTAVRPRPRVCARSAKIGPADVDVRTGTPASNRNVSPPLVDPIAAKTLSVAGEYADRMVLLAGGEVVASGPPQEVLTEANLARYYHARVKVIAGEQGPLVVPVRGRLTPSPE